MSHLRRVVALIMLALLGWLVAFGAMEVAPAAASTTSAHTKSSAYSYCC